MEAPADTAPIVVVASEESVSGYDKYTGQLLWHTPLDGSTLNSPDLVIHGHVVLVATNTSKLFCLEYATGAVRWSAPLAKSNVQAPQPRIVVHDGHAFVAGHGSLECISLLGEPRWRVKLPDAGTGGSSFGFPAQTRRAPDKPH